MTPAAGAFLEEMNTAFRALTESGAERRAVRDSFATSVLWGVPVEKEEPDGRLLVDFTSFLTGDVHGIAREIEAAGQGAFTLDAARSSVELEGILAFPDNVEVDALLTFTSPKPGPLVQETAPDPHSITLVHHHSFVRLPDPGYRPRRFDPRAGSFSIAFLDYAAPLDRPTWTRWMVRHRLEKTDRGAARSRVKEPIVYHVDSGVPEPVRSALVEGARWWARAFDEAGFIDAFRVEILPEDVHPLDARYNVIHWVHRSTRGWSYGGGMIDPRTGEMISANVRLGSQRVRHDRLLFEGLAGTAASGSGAPDDPVLLALARIRQLSAHEVGHTLGLAHNFAASTYGRASVMDYPAPLVTVGADGSLDFSRAYAEGVGEWDVHAIRCAYGEPPPGVPEEAFLDGLAQEARRKGLLFLTDEDARPGGAAHPAAGLWDNGEDPAGELERVMEVRRIALERFGEDRVAAGTPLALLQEVFLPVYFHHRYQLDAAAKVIGGLEYDYAVRGEETSRVRMVGAGRQEAALSAILQALDPARLDIPESTLSLLLPRTFGHPGGVDLIASRTAPAFDAMGAAATAASMAVSTLLQPERAARLVDHHRRDPAQPGLRWLLDGLVERAFGSPAPPPERQAALAGAARGAVVDGLIALSAHERVTDEVRAATDGAHRRLRARLEPARGPGAEGDLAELLAGRIGRYLDRQIRDLPAEPAAPAAPPGSPIGGGLGPAGRGVSGCSLDDGSPGL
ncbi:MAG: zinc-dependent metalloprotease [Candidatus Rokubacteria bacterium]|nr:zinc-dependent metalloprotease [Candidatus Rokubacteria bacterium]